MLHPAPGFSGVSPGFGFVLEGLVEAQGTVQESWWFILVFKAPNTEESSEIANTRQRSYKHSQGNRASVQMGFFTGVHTHKSGNNVFTVDFAIKQFKF